MNKNILKGLALASVAALTLAGCASAPSTPTVTPVDYKACMVSDQGGFKDASFNEEAYNGLKDCLLYTSPSPRDRSVSRMPSSA